MFKIHTYTMILAFAMDLGGCGEIECPPGSERVVRRSFIEKKTEYCVDRDGKRNGPELSWFEDGAKRQEYYIHGMSDGSLKTWWPNGNPQEEGVFWIEENQSNKYQKKVGMWKYWHKNGRLQIAVYYNNGEYVYSYPQIDTGKEKKCWDENGVIVKCPPLWNINVEHGPLKEIVHKKYAP